MKLPKNMTNGEKTALHLDFAHTFFGEEVITAEGLFNWATNTQAFYNWFFTRFEAQALVAVKQKRFHKYEKSYEPMFMEWCSWEIIPCAYADFMRGCANVSKTKMSPMAEYDASRELFKHYVKIFKEKHGIV